MTDRCWDELRWAGKEIADAYSLPAIRQIVKATVVEFDLPRSPEAEAAGIFLRELNNGLSAVTLLDEFPLPELPEAAE